MTLPAVRDTAGVPAISPSSWPHSDGPVIRARGLTRRYGSLTAVDHLDLEVHAGEIFGLLGPNGAGKTTTVLMLLGLSEPTSGEARVLGLDPTREPLTIKRRVGYLPDNVGFYGGLTGRQNLRYTARLNDIREADAKGRIEASLAQVGLVEAADRKVDTYSRGMRQRLGIADALVKNPEVLILDEPTTAIDPEGVVELLALIRRLADERGLATLLSSHLLEQVQSICDRVGIFVGGRMVASGRIGELAAATGAGRIEIAVDGPPDAARALLAGVPGVEAVTAVPGHERHWMVNGAPGIRAALVEALVGAGLALSYLNEHGHDLGDIYRRLVAEAGTRPAAPAPGSGDESTRVALGGMAGGAEGVPPSGSAQAGRAPAPPPPGGPRRADPSADVGRPRARGIPSRRASRGSLPRRGDDGER